MTAGLLLAAGAGSRMGRPKALVDEWLVRSVEVLAGGGCAPVVVVLGARADEARPLLAGVDRDVEVVVADDWSTGMSASLRAGLAHLAASGTDAVLVHLVDLPDVGAEAVRRVLAAADGPASLARAVYDGRPGHPVLIGRDHWASLLSDAAGDRGARDLLGTHPHATVECGDLATGYDVDQR